ncbi:MAG TPA: hypothetical protein VHW09_18255 [Bryobacteraceae bacterium]|jgi:hypothetical protein|nr:hypothetical protein [Bryobacteraceae bacterium]
MKRTPVWLWPNLLSLDAPIVALVWQDLAAHSFGNPLRAAARVVLGLTVWAVYLADRLLDVRAAGLATDTARHRFSRRHYRALSVLLAAVLLVDIFVATVELRRAVLLHGLAVAACVGAYLFIFPQRASGWEKQACCAVLFSIGVLLVSATSLSPLHLLLPAVLYAGLCLCDLVLIELWERAAGRRVLWIAPAAIAAVALAIHGPWYHAVALAGVLLAALAISGKRITMDAKRVLADAALLTPLLFR